MQTESSALIVGSLAFDDLEMPTGNFDNVLGGAATYSSLAASLLAPVRIVGVVGSDFGEEHLRMMQARGIDTHGVERASGKTFRWRGRYAADLLSRTTLDTQLNVFADFRPKIPAAYKKSDFVLLGNIHPALQLEVLDQIEKPRLTLADTMNFWISGEPKLLAEMLRRIDLLIINEEEARDLSGIHNVSRAAADILRRGPSRLIIKRGEYGAMLFDNSGMFFVPGYPLEEVLDPTGAGDTFAGGLLGYLTKHSDPSPNAVRRAMFFASALASFCVEEIGTRRLTGVSKADLKKRVEGFVRLVDFGGNLVLAD
ncbi:MAG: sugar kinase [Myxococcales bacterium]|nr:sugar kinase [Myxococcales bacterium]